MARFFWDYLNLGPLFLPAHLVHFDQAVQAQEYFLNEIQSISDSEDAVDNFILFAEHSSVYPIPPPRNENIVPDFRNADYMAHVRQFFQSDSHLHLDKLFTQELREDKTVAYLFENNGDDIIELYPLSTRRGGSITYHGPGQLVCYLILASHRAKLKLHEISSMVLNAIKTILLRLGVQAYRLDELVANADYDVMQQLVDSQIFLGHTRENTVKLNSAANGIWVINKETRIQKIASYGSQHHRTLAHVTCGFALNISTDLFYFDQIYPCGMDITMTSVEEITGQRHKLHEVARMLAIEIVEEIKKVSGDASHILI